MEYKGIFSGNKDIWFVFLLLSLFSILGVYSASVGVSYRETGGDTFRYLIRHFSFLVIGMLTIILTRRIPTKSISKYIEALWIISIILLFVTIIQKYFNHSSGRFLDLGIIRFQTSDLAKISLLLLLSRRLSLKNEDIKSIKEALKILFLPIIITVGLIFPLNGSTGFMLFGVCCVLLFIGDLKLKYLFSGIVLTILGFVLIALICVGIEKATGASLIRKETWISRFENTYTPKADNYQIQLTKAVVADAGWIGKGPGNSFAKNILSQSESDLIFVVLLDELGIIPMILLIMSYVYLIFYVIKIVKKSEDTFSTYASMSIVILIATQAFVHFGAITGLLPFTGQPLPLVSIGGTSILFYCFGLGVILSTNREANNLETKEDEVVSQKENKYP